jgi:hypothetical protein
MQTLRDSSFWSLEHVIEVQLTTEFEFFQLEIKFIKLSASFPSGFIKSSLGSPFGVPQSPLKGSAIIVGI